MLLNEMYKCSFCGAEYSDPIARARCELECDEKVKQERRKEEKKKLLEQREVRRQELIQLRRTLDELTRKYYQDYPMDDYSIDDVLFAEIFPFLARWRK